MASVETGARPQAATTTIDAAALARSWSTKLTRYASNTGMAAVNNHGKVDTGLRVLLFVFSLIAVVVMVTSKQSKTIPASPTMTVHVDAKFTHSASFTYFVAAFSVIGLYSIITGYWAYLSMKKQDEGSIGKHLYLVILDSLALGIAASATGAGGGVAYEALKGNPHIRWMKICNIFDKFCHHLASAGALALLTSATLLLLLWISVAKLVTYSTGRR